MWSLLLEASRRASTGLIYGLLNSSASLGLEFGLKRSWHLHAHGSHQLIPPKDLTHVSVTESQLIS